MGLITAIGDMANNSFGFETKLSNSFQLVLVNCIKKELGVAVENIVDDKKCADNIILYISNKKIKVNLTEYRNSVQIVGLLSSKLKLSVGGVKVAKDNREYDSKGNRVKFKFVEHVERDLMEPYDPAYLEESVEEEYVDEDEKTFMKKVGIIERALKKERIAFEYQWDGDFIVSKVSESGYMKKRYVRWYSEDNEYAFSTEKQDLVWSTKVRDVVKAVKEWLAK